MNCPLCASTTESFTEAAGRTYRFCPRCRLVSVPPAHHLSRDEEIARYREHENSLENPGYVNMFMEKIREIRKHRPAGGPALDFGCGYEPVLVHLLNREGYRAEGYDIHFFPQWPGGRRFDLVISTETFEHLRHPAAELDRLDTLLATGGDLAVMTRYYPAEADRPDADAFGRWYYQRDPTHIAFYRPETFRWIARARGWDVVFDNGRDFAILRKP